MVIKMRNLVLFLAWLIPLELKIQGVLVLMKLYEYQGKELFKEYNIPVPKGTVVVNSEEARKAALEIGTPLMVKAQIFQGGRGKAGGVRLAQSLQEVTELVSSLLAEPLKNEVVKYVLLEEAIATDKECYLGITIDDRLGQPVIVACPEGGMEIEEMANQFPEKLLRYFVNPIKGLRQYEAVEISKKLNFKGNLLVQIANILFNLYQLFVHKDAQLAEINPLLINKQGRVLAGDAKIILNDDALFRQNEYTSLFSEEVSDNDLEAIARSKGFNFVDLDGQIGVISIGAGFGMMLLDVIAHYGCKPANFIDASGGIAVDAFKEMADLVFLKAEQTSQVKVIIASCGLAATPLENIVNGMVAAVRNRRPCVPVVASITADGPSTLNMTLAEAAEILTKAGILYFPDLQEAVETAVRITREKE